MEDEKIEKVEFKDVPTGELCEAAVGFYKRSKKDDYQNALFSSNLVLMGSYAAYNTSSLP